jgi:hypothetical protein
MNHSYFAFLDFIFGNYLFSYEAIKYENYENVPLFFILNQLSRVIPMWILQYLCIIGIFIIGYFSISHLLSKIFTKKGILFWSFVILFLFSPFVYARFFIWQIWVMLAYMILPWVIAIGQRLYDATSFSRRDILEVVWLSVWIGMVNVRFFPMVLIFFVSLFVIRFMRNPKIWKITLRDGLLYAWISIIFSSYWIVPLIYSDTVSIFSQQDLAIFSSHASWWRVLMDTLSMNGTWSDSMTNLYSPFQSFGFTWIIIWVLLFSLSLFGFLRYPSGYKYLILWFALFSWIFSTGTSVPLISDINIFLYQYIPFFNGYREPQKWISWIVLFYIFFGAYGMKAYIDSKSFWGSILWDFLREGIRYSVFGFSILLILTVVTAFLQARPMIQYPETWYSARVFTDAHIDKDEKVLVFPWHWYMGCDFTRGRTVQNPAWAFFGPQFVYGDNIEIANIYTYSKKPLSQIIDTYLPYWKTGEKLEQMTSELKNQGIEKIILLKWCADAKVYGFLDTKLSPSIYENANIEIYTLQ